MLKNLCKDTAIYGVADCISKLIAFGIFPFYTHVLSVEEFGIFALVTSLACLISILFNIGLNNAIQHYYLDLKSEPSMKPVIVSTGLSCLVIIGVIISGLFLFWAAQFEEVLLRHLQITWQMLALGILGAFFLQLNTFCLDVIRLYFQPKKFAWLNLFQTFVMVSLTFYWVVGLGWGVLGYLGGTAVAYMSVLPLSLWVIRKEITHRLSWSIAQKLLRFGYPFIFAGIAFWIFSSMDRWMLGEMSDNVQTGLYSIAFKFASLMIFFNTALGQAWTPFAYKMRNSTTDYKNVFSHFMVLWLYFMVLIALVLSLFGQELLLFLTPPAYWSASYVLPYIVCGLSLVGAGQIMGVGISLEGKTIHFTYASWLTAGVNFLLNLQLIPIFGAVGAAVATFISNLLLFGYYLFCSQKFHPLPLSYKKIGVCVALIFVCLSFQYWILNQPWSWVLVGYKLTFICAALVTGFLAQVVSVPEVIQFFKRRVSLPEGAAR